MLTVQSHDLPLPVPQVGGAAIDVRFFQLAKGSVHVRCVHWCVRSYA